MDRSGPVSAPRPFADMLRISRLTDYALVVMAHLAREAHVCVHPATAIAEVTGLPQPTVAKILKALSREGLLHSVRGAAGGYSLARDPRAVSVADVIAAMEGPIALTACSVHGGEPCADVETCQLADHWPHINGAIASALAGVSVWDLARPADRLHVPTPRIRSVTAPAVRATPGLTVPSRSER